MRKGAGRILLQVLLSVALLVVLAFKIDLAHLAELCRGLRWPPLLGIVAAVLGDRALMAYKWNLLLRARGVIIPFRAVFQVYYFSTFVGIFLPVSVGADLVRGFKLYKDGHGGSTVATSIIIERMLGLAAGATAAAIASAVIMLWLKAPIFPLLVFALGMLAAFALVFYVSLHTRVLAWLPFRQHVLVRKLLELHESYSAYRHHGGVLAGFFLLSVVEQIFPVLSHYAAGQALGLNVPFWVYLVTLPPVQLVARLPISFNGTGVIEGMLAYVFKGLSYSATQAVALGLLVEVVSMLTLLPALFFRTRTEREIR